MERRLDTGDEPDVGDQPEVETSPDAAAASPGRVEGDAVLESSDDAVEGAGVDHNGGAKINGGGVDDHHHNSIEDDNGGGVDDNSIEDDNGGAGVDDNGGAGADDNSVDVMLLLGQFRDLAAHPKTRNTLIQDATSLGGLVLLLNDSNPNIVEHTLEIFLLLSKSKDCCQALFHQLGFIESLDNIVIEYGDRREDGGNVARMAVQILNKLTARPPRPHSPASSTSSLKSDENRKRDRRTSAQQRSFDSSYSNHTTSATGGATRPPNTKIQKHQQQKSNSKTITLQIKGLLDVHDRDSCREKLLEVRGVVSLTFDMKLKRAVLRVKSDLRAEDLVLAVMRTQTMSASQVVFDGDGNETLVSFAHLSLSGDCAENEEGDFEYPDYLDDADELPSPEKGHKAMSRVKGEDVNEGSSWFNSVSSFVKDAFYW